MAIAEEVFWSPSSTFYWFLTFVFFFTAVLVTQLTTLVSSSQHSASHKQLHLCSKTKTQTQTQTKTKTGQKTRKTLCKRKMVEPILYFNVLFCNKFSHCETNRGGRCISSVWNKKENQPTNPFHFISFHEWVLHKGKFIQAFLAGPHKES
jgi:hypothetical protein